MPAWDDMNKLKDALIGGGDNKDHPVPAGGSKNQDQVRAEIHGETKKVEQIQATEGWSDKVCVHLAGQWG